MSNNTGATLTQLRDAVQAMDCQAQSGFSDIATIAKLALCWLEKVEGNAATLEVVDQALRLIWLRADDTENLINCEAENVGCNYVDEVARQRFTSRITKQGAKP